MVMEQKSPTDRMSKHTTICEETDRAHITITFRCNNNCIFCIQGYRPNARHRDYSEITREIDIASQRGVDKVIISGGEPTIHPDFLRIISYCAAQSFNIIQVVTNGRMFSIGDFAKKAVKAGLSEVTLSIHGPNAEIHDKLVNYKGAFRQITEAVENLRSYNIIISVDIGIFSQNYEYLPEMIDMVHERFGLKGDVDLMGPAMKGNAAINQASVMPEYENVSPYLQRALDRCYEYGKVCWVLRVPLQYMEGYEFYRQDSEKLVEQALSTARPPKDFPAHCKGDNCRFCRMQFICDSLEKIYSSINIKNSSMEKIDIIIRSDDANALQKLSAVDFPVRKLIFEPETMPLLRKMQDYHKDEDYIVFRNFHDAEQLCETIDSWCSLSRDKIRFEFDLVSLDTSLSEMFGLDVDGMLQSIGLLQKKGEVRVNIFLTRHNQNELPQIIQYLNKKGIQRINVTAFNPHHFVHRNLDWNTGVSLTDSHDMVPEMDSLENRFHPLISMCDEKDINLTFENIPLCLFSDHFIEKFSNYFMRDPFLHTMWLDALNFDKTTSIWKIDFRRYVRFAYDTLYKERIAACSDCKYRNSCAGMYEMLVKLRSFEQISQRGRKLI
ncbi:MAG: radical SAM protein [Candidatus Woesearchaeota archaeon]